MIILRTNLPLANRNDVWASEINIKNLIPARRDKLVALIDSSSFVLRTDSEDIKVAEIRNINEVLMIEDGL